MSRRANWVLSAAEIRRRNLIRPKEMPFRRTYDQPGVEPMVLDPGDYPVLLREGAGAPFGFNTLKEDIARTTQSRRDRGPRDERFLRRKRHGARPTARARRSIPTETSN